MRVLADANFGRTATINLAHHYLSIYNDNRKQKEIVMIYFAFDLSFTGTGICMMNDAEKKISFCQVKTTLDKRKTFESVQRGITSILQSIENIICDNEHDKRMKIVMGN